MNKESLGKRYKKNSDIYECIAYTDKPTVTMENIETKERVNVVIGSMLSNDFVEITNKIEKLDILKMDEYGVSEESFVYKNSLKINEIIDYINNMEENYGRK